MIVREVIETTYLLLTTKRDKKEILSVLYRQLSIDNMQTEQTRKEKPVFLLRFRKFSVVPPTLLQPVISINPSGRGMLPMRFALRQYSFDSLLLPISRLSTME